MTELRTHYSSPGLLARIEQGLNSTGKSADSVGIDDLAPVDEFHLLGPIATQELIEILDVGPGSRVLDVGSGLGGPARRLAQAVGCHVTGVDLSEDYCAVGNELTRWVGLSESVHLEPGDATKLDRFDDGSFDAAWSIHVGMNIEDKASLYASLARVLAPGGPLVIFDILSAAKGDIQFPTPWASSPKHSFLATADEMRAHLAGAGLTVVDTRDRTTQALAFLDENFARIKKLGGPPPLGLHLILGPAFQEIIARGRQDLAHGLLAPTVIHVRKTQEGSRDE